MGRWGGGRAGGSRRDPGPPDTSAPTAGPRGARGARASARGPGRGRYQGERRSDRRWQGTEHDELTDARLLRFSAAGVFVSELTIAVDLEYYFVGSLTIDAQGRALVAGGVGTWDHDGFFGVYTEDGELLSSITMDGFGKLDSFNGLAAAPSGVALVGGVTTSDTVRDAWVVKLAP